MEDLPGALTFCCRRSCPEPHTDPRTGQEEKRRMNYVESLTAGKRLPNGTWSGLFGMLQRKELDITGVLVQSLHRSQDFLWTQYLYMDEHTIAYQRPLIESDIVGFYKPFTGQVWMFLAMVLLVMPLCFYLLRWGTQQLHQQRPQLSNVSMGSESFHQHRQRSMLLDSLLWTVSPLLNQSFTRGSTKGVVRVLTGLWLLLVFILNTVYRSNLKAMLILPKINLPFNSLEEFTQTNLPVWVPYDSHMYSIATRAEKNSTLGKFRQHFLNQRNNDIPEAITQLIAGRHAVSGPLSSLLQLMHAHFQKTRECPYYVMSQNFLKTNILSIFLQKGSTFKAKFDPLLIGMREFGILEHMQRQAVTKAEECHKPVSAMVDSFRSLSLADFYGVFLIYIGGMFVATIVFSLEMSLRKCFKRNST